jgi:hypothetical protein
LPWMGKLLPEPWRVTHMALQAQREIDN